MDVREVIKKVFVACPYDLLVAKYLDRLVEAGINPEIGLNRAAINNFSIPDFVRTAAIFRNNGISCTVHAPFTDISMGAIDNSVRAASLDRLRAALDIASVLGAGSIVMHLGYDRQQYLGAEEQWLDNTLSSLDMLVEHASLAGTRIFLENVYEPDPGFHSRIFDAIDSRLLGFCLDLGHLNVFSPHSSMEQWLKGVGHRLGELHIHDNRGREDEHLPVGQGGCDFDALFSWLEKRHACPVITVEAHDEKAVFPSLEAVGKLLDRYGICQGPQRSSRHAGMPEHGSMPMPNLS